MATRFGGADQLVDFLAYLDGVQDGPGLRGDPAVAPESDNPPSQSQ